MWPSPAPCRTGAIFAGGCPRRRAVRLSLLAAIGGAALDNGEDVVQALDVGEVNLKAGHIAVTQSLHSRYIAVTLDIGEVNLKAGARWGRG